MKLEITTNTLPAKTLAITAYRLPILGIISAKLAVWHLGRNTLHEVAITTLSTKRRITRMASWFICMVTMAGIGS